MSEYTFDIVCNVTYGCTVQASSLEEAEEIARNQYERKLVDVIDEGIVAIDLIEEHKLP